MPRPIICQNLVFDRTELEEDEVHDLRHVDAGVEHVDRDGDVRRLVRVREIVDQRLRVVGLEVDHAREVPCKMRVVRVEALCDELGMVAGSWRR